MAAPSAAEEYAAPSAAEEYADLDALDDNQPPDAVQGPSGKVYGPETALCNSMRPSDQPRKFTIRLVEQPVFDQLILLTILCNCVTMAWQSPLDPTGTQKAAFIDVCEWIYLYIFTFEMIVKMCAYSFLNGPGAYLKDAWCQVRLQKVHPLSISISFFIFILLNLCCCTVRVRVLLLSATAAGFRRREPSLAANPLPIDG